MAGVDRGGRTAAGEDPQPRFRNRERFANATPFNLGGLDLYPDGLPA